MNFQIPSIVTYSAAWFASLSGVWTLFERAENIAKEDLKKAVSSWLKNTHVPNRPKWPAIFALLFDRVFGTRHWSFSCFLRSSLASVIAVTIMTFVWGAIRPEDFFSRFESGSDFFVIFIMAGMFNLIPDYISLLESRYVIKLLGKRPSTFKLLSFLIIDFFLTAIIAASPILFIMVSTGSIDEAIGTIKQGVLFDTYVDHNISFGIVIYATFFTSIWVWLYVISGFFFKITVSLRKRLKIAIRYIDVDNKPIRSLGFVSMIFVTLIYGLIPFIN